MKDDRNRDVRLVRPEDLDASIPVQAELRAALDALPEAWGWNASVLRFALRFLVVVAAYAAGLILLKQFVAPLLPVPTIVILIFYFLVVPIVLRPLHNLFRERHPGTVIKEAASRGLCPSCGYALAGLSREHDNRIVCPECSAAWLPSRFPRGMVESSMPAGDDDSAP
jgi:hypothetical protein